MIRRLYVDNFRSLVDFTWEPGKETLVLGYNGSGKTSVFDALDVVRVWAGGWAPIQGELGHEDVTRWSGSTVVRLALDIQIGDVAFRYEVEFDCHESHGSPAVRSEALWADDRRLVDRTLEVVEDYRGESAPHSTFSLSRGQSALSSLAEDRSASLVRTFVRALGRMVVVRPIPPLMEPEARRPEARASSRFENFIAWYWRHHENAPFDAVLAEELGESWDRFEALSLVQAGRDTQVLNVAFRGSEEEEGRTSLDFSELSEGERMLIALYSLVAYQRSQEPTTIVIDEPDNFVSILELQPWLLTMLDTCPDDGQLILISHNPEVIQTMGRENVAYFSRRDHLSSTHVRGIRPEEVEFASLRDLVRRGWLDG